MKNIEKREIDNNVNIKKPKKEMKIKVWVLLVILIVLIALGMFAWRRINSDICNEYDGEYYKITVGFTNYVDDESKTEFYQLINNTEIINSYDEYKNILEIAKKCNKLKIMSKIKEDAFDTNNFAIVSLSKVSMREGSEILSVVENGNTLNVRLYSPNNTTLAISACDVFFFPVSKNINNVNREIESPSRDSNVFYTEKPIIYLYPQEEIELSVKLGYPEKITCSYPKYKNGWNVIAKPDGTLIDTDTERCLYSLYWEGTNTMNIEMKDGFVVKGEDTIKFLEEKLEILGLNEREAEEFIVYWLPKLEANKYNYIRFATKEEINKDMPLEFSVEPDTLIRILLEFKGLDDYIEIPEQKLETPERKGFVAVEWGGTELK